MPRTVRRFRQTVAAPAFHQTGPGANLIKTTSANNQFAGRTAITSGSATATVSTNVVKSDSLIFLSYELPAAEAVTTSLGPLCVRTISDGNRFTIGWANGGNIASSQVQVMWKIELGA